MPTSAASAILAYARREPECLVQDCGAVKFLRQIEGFTFHADAIASAKAITLFERGSPAPRSSQDDLWEIPF